MFQILFSKYALVFYIAAINVEVLIKYSFTITAEKRKTAMLKISDALNIVLFVFMLFYSFVTVWWAFAGLILIYTFIFVSIKYSFTLMSKISSTEKKYLGMSKSSSNAVAEAHR